MSRHRLDSLLQGVRRSFFPPDNLPEVKGPVALWGAGSTGRLVAATLRSRGVEIAAVTDNDSWRHGDEFCGAPIVPPFLLSRLDPLPVFICYPQSWHTAMQLRQMGFDEYYVVADPLEWPAYPVLDHADEILAVYDLLADSESKTNYLSAIRMRQEGSGAYSLVAPYIQYKHPRAKPLAGDNIINGGGFVGHTADNFVRTTQRQCRIWSFEPCREVFAELEANIARFNISDIVTPANMALWNSRTELTLNSPNPFNGNSSINAAGCQKVNAISIDAFAADNGIDRIDLIELDVEGSESKALNGAIRTIRRFRPRLHISVYHKPAHLWSLALWVRDLGLGYTMYLGHHTHAYGETTLYCVA